MTKRKIIISAKNLNGQRGEQLYCVSKDTLSFVNAMDTNVRGMSFEAVATVVKSNYTTKTLVADNGKRYKMFDDCSVVERV